MGHYKRKLLIDLTAAGIIIAALIVAISYFGNNISDRSAQIIDHRGELLQRSASLDTLATLISQYNTKGKNYLDVLHTTVPVHDDLFGLKQEFQFLASQANLTSTFELLDEIPPQGDGLGSVGFRLTVEGDYGSLLAFVRVLQQFQHLTTIDSLTIAVKNTTTDAMAIRGRVFFR